METHLIDREQRESLRLMLLSEDIDDIHLAVEILNNAELQDPDTVNNINCLLKEPRIELYTHFGSIENGRKYPNYFTSRRLIHKLILQRR